MKIKILLLLTIAILSFTVGYQEQAYDSLLEEVHIQNENLLFDNVYLKSHNEAYNHELRRVMILLYKEYNKDPMSREAEEMRVFMDHHGIEYPD